jgi:hypothetical protein
MSEAWFPVADALTQIDRFERDHITILGLELARITPDERVLLPAFADFSGCGEAESWAFARELVREIPPDATHVTFVTSADLG